MKDATPLAFVVIYAAGAALFRSRWGGIAVLAGQRVLWVTVTATNEVVSTTPAFPGSPGELTQLLNVFLGAATGANPAFS